MKKHKPTGRKFSKKQVTPFYGENRIYDAFKYLHEINNFQSFKEWLPFAKQEAQEFLKNKNLPFSRRMYCIKEGDWTDKQLKLDQYLYGLNLSNYLNKEKGYCEDSPEFLTARAIELITKLESKEYQQKSDIYHIMESAYQLGQLFIKGEYYAEESERQRKIAKRSRNELHPLIKELSSHEGSAKELWNTLITKMDNDNYKPIEFIKNGNPCLTYSDNDKKTLALGTFQNLLTKFRKEKSS